VIIAAALHAEVRSGRYPCVAPSTPNRYVTLAKLCNVLDVFGISVEDETARVVNGRYERGHVTKRGSAGANGSGSAETRILREAQRCFDRYGLHRTTMDDIARAAGVSRMTLYRYFSDREALITAIVSKRSTRLVDKVHTHLAQYPTLSEQLVEGLMYLADRGRQDHFIGILLASETIDFTNKLLFKPDGSAVAFAQAVWEPLLDAAALRGELPQDFSRESIYVWLTSVNFMMIAWLQNPDAETSYYRGVLEQFVLPAFAAPI
jgi:AcrR family transcriptional regulator